MARFNGLTAPSTPAGSVLVEERADPTDPSRIDLFITGSEGHDSIRIEPGSGAGQLVVIANGVVVGTTFQPTGRVIVRGRGGNDNIQVHATGASGIEIDGEAGTDTTVVFLGGLTGPVMVSDSAREDSLVVNGTAGDDYLVKTGSQVTLGNPVIQSILFTNLGNIIIDGGEGNDLIVDPGAGAVILGGAGDDTLEVAETTGDVWLDGGEGSDSYSIRFGGLWRR